jgi:hypothetical protein
MVLIMSMVLLQFNQQMERRDKQISYDSAQATFTQLALAQFDRSVTFVDAADVGLGFEGYAETPLILYEEGFLPLWEDPGERWSFELGPQQDPSLTINFEADSAFAARQIAVRMGNLTEVEGTLVKVGFINPKL